jgi:L-threonylcarbamoyladenylate synthase
MRIFKITKQNFNKTVKAAVKSIKSGQVIICPTDTVYIPAADASNKEAVRKVFLLKRRSLKKPTPIFVKDIKTAKKIAKINKKQEKFLQLVWPGKVTVILKRKKAKIKLYGVSKETIALRIPNFKLVNLLLKELNKPLVGTSANISGKPAPGTLKQVLQQIGKNKHQLDLIVDAGKLAGKPSTVIDLTVSPPRILRD